LPGRNPELLRLLVTYQTMWDFLDSANEHGAAAGQANGLRLHEALVDALDPSYPISGYYSHHPWCEDSGYLRALVGACRDHFVQLPSSERVRAVVVREARRANVQAINHDLNGVRRAASLRAWVAREFPSRQDATWYELAGAAGAGLSIYALIVLAAEPACTDADIDRAYNAYFPWTSAVATMLDSHVDRAEDVAAGDHVYVAHYPTPELAIQGIRRLVRRALVQTRSLDNCERHVLVIACMVAMYLSKDSARCEAMRSATRTLAKAGGSLTRLLLPVLRLWRTLYKQRMS
jgi:tetraprenyl-beta-curcumene synthase